ncbi:MAG: carboxymuconolactone decarboxylase family protein [Clostridia bacterium]
MPHIPFPDSEHFHDADHIIRIEAWNEPVTHAHLSLYRRLMFGPSPLSRTEREAIALVVSTANHCHY